MKKIYAILAALLLPTLWPASATAETIIIIANSSVELATAPSLEQIATFYLLRTSLWPNGSHIVPVNREAGSDIRKKFTSEVLKQDSIQLTAYWNTMHFMGKQPPVVQESDQAVLAFVQKVPGSIGYISSSAHPTNVKILGTVP